MRVAVDVTALSQTRAGTARYLHALLPRLEPEVEVEQIAGDRKVSYDEKDRLDRMEAWMPESIAIMKLRAFSDSVGGELADSEPGRIRIRVADPRTPPAPPTTEPAPTPPTRSGAAGTPPPKILPRTQPTTRPTTPCVPIHACALRPHAAAFG